jgi:hypothetical protein
MKPDLVYVLKDSKTNEEFRYSLRSVVKNVKNYNKIITVGGMVDGIEPDISINIIQPGHTKYDKVNTMLKEICLNPLISENFVLMNDDFFIMDTLDLDKYKPNYRCSLEDYMQIIVDAKAPSIYTMRLAKTTGALNALGLGTKCYELHIPMLFNKHKLLEVFGVFTGFNGIRSLYGNYFKIGGQKINDCKIFTTSDDFVKNTKYLSTTDKSFRVGAVGEYIRSKFPDPSKFEH